MRAIKFVKIYEKLLLCFILSRIELMHHLGKIFKNLPSVLLASYQQVIGNFDEFAHKDY